MMTFSWLFLLVLSGICVGPGAFARIPESPAEKSLLYWRYLCRNQVQEESIQNQVRVVRTPASEGKVKEIVEHEAP